MIKNNHHFCDVKFCNKRYTPLALEGCHLVLLEPNGWSLFSEGEFVMSECVACPACGERLFRDEREKYRSGTL